MVNFHDLIDKGDYAEKNKTNPFIMITDRYIYIYIYIYIN